MHAYDAYEMHAYDAYEMHAYDACELHAYGRHAYGVAYGRCTPNEMALRERHAYEMAPYEMSEIGRVPN